MSENRLKRTISSALWAAYGDAMGFPTELASDQLIRERLGQPRATRTEKWKRVVGGRFGAQVNLPAGAYSDDTQLRLSTSRAISGQGYFDVEAFAKIELPVWLVYALGAGRGSKSAANSLCNRGANWFSNFYEGYENGGGNGAAMRVQPHVWAAQDLGNKPSYLVDVIRNAICTHGHMRGIAGAVVHALSLAYALEHGRVPAETEWHQFTADIRSIASLIKSDPDLATFWVPTWEKATNQSLEIAVNQVAIEWDESVRNAATWIARRSEPPAAIYEGVVVSDRGLSNEERGSGLKCALFANVAALQGQLIGSQEIIEHVVNLISSDTDTIATMAGALIGAAYPDSRYLGKIQDEEYIRFEATRLYSISQGDRAQSFTYPDMLYWQAPKSAIDSLISTPAGFLLQGLGNVKPVGGVYLGKQKTSVWQWFEGSWGQTLLIRYRNGLMGGGYDAKRPSHASKQTGDMFNQPVSDLFSAHGSVSGLPSFEDEQASKSMSTEFGQSDVTSNTSSSLTLGDKEIISCEFSGEVKEVNESPDLDALTNEAIKTFDPLIIGKHLLELAELPNGIFLAVAYSSIIAKARIARIRSKRKDRS